MVGWHHRLNGHGFGWTLGVGDGQGGLACCGSWGRKESDTTEQFHLTPHSIAQFSLTQKAQNYFRGGALVVILTFTCHQTKELPLRV